MFIAFLSVLLSLTPAWAAKNRCGDGVVRSGEQCDGASLAGQTCTTLGYSGGTLGCTSTCTFNTSACTTGPVCGDGVAEGTEACDGADLKGQTCGSLGWAGGTLSCSPSCTLDAGTCADGLTCGDGLTGGYEECDGLADAACPGLCTADCACPSTAAGDLEIHVIDVGQGDAILVVSPDGYAMLVDAGGAGSAAKIQAYMVTIGLTSLDYVVVSHMHADHLGGMDDIFAAFPEIVASFDHGGSATSTEYLDYDSAAGARRVSLITGDLLDLGSATTIEVLHSWAGSANENDNSVVLSIDYGAYTYLLGGDCEEACEASLLPGRAHVYKAHHHGADNGSTSALLDTLDPWTALISVGAGNSYGHPTVGTLGRLADAQASVYRTDLDGDIPIIATPSVYTVDGEAVCLPGDARICGLTDVGQCSLGWHECALGAWNEATCVGAVYPVLEDCSNTVDDDCDGLLDATDPDCAFIKVRLAQVAYDTPGSDTVEEYVDLYNSGTSVADVSGWTLSDNGGTFALPAGTLIGPSAYLTVARSTAGLFAWRGLNSDVTGMSLSFSNSGDRLVLRTGAGAEIDRVAWESYDAGWTVSAATGNSIYRSPVTLDTDVSSDWKSAASMPLGGY